MDRERKQDKRVIRGFLREHYSDEKLVMLLAHTQSSKLAYMSCCCLVGVPSADHALQGKNYKVPSCHPDGLSSHAEPADKAYYRLGRLDHSRFPLDNEEEEAARRRRLVSIIKAEIRRRDRERQAIHSEVMELSFVAR